MKVAQYINEAIKELVEKVTWPTWKDLIESSIIVAITSILFALSISLMDYVMGVNQGIWKGILGYFYQLF